MRSFASLRRGGEPARDDGTGYRFAGAQRGMTRRLSRPRASRHTRRMKNTTRGNPLFAYVGSYTTPERHGQGNGINVYKVDRRTGAFGHVQHLGGLENPSFLAINAAGTHLYSVHGDRTEATPSPSIGAPAISRRSTGNRPAATIPCISPSMRRSASSRSATTARIRWRCWRSTATAACCPTGH